MPLRSTDSEKESKSESGRSSDTVSTADGRTEKVSTAAENARTGKVSTAGAEGRKTTASRSRSPRGPSHDYDSDRIPDDIHLRNERSVHRSTVNAYHDGLDEDDASVPESVRKVVSSAGHSLDTSVQRTMESRMGEDFSDVQVHTGPRAAKAAEDINAKAFTVGNHVAFNRGEYDPSSAEGQHVIAHELAHVRQQTDGAVSMLPQDDIELEIDPDPELEREAEETAQRVMQGGEVGIQRMKNTDVHVQRAPPGHIAMAPPSTSGVSAAPSSSTPAAPPAGSHPAAPPAGSHPAAPPAGSHPAAPPAGSHPAAPPAGSHPAAPPAGSHPAAPPAGSTTGHVSLPMPDTSFYREDPDEIHPPAFFSGEFWRQNGTQWKQAIPFINDDGAEIKKWDSEKRWRIIGTGGLGTLILGTIGGQVFTLPLVSAWTAGGVAGATGGGLVTLGLDSAGLWMPFQNIVTRATGLDRLIHRNRNYLNKSSLSGTIVGQAAIGFNDINDEDRTAGENRESGLGISLASGVSAQIATFWASAREHMKNKYNERQADIGGAQTALDTTNSELQTAYRLGLVRSTVSSVQEVIRESTDPDMVSDALSRLKEAEESLGNLAGEIEAAPESGTTEDAEVNPSQINAVTKANNAREQLERSGAEMTERHGESWGRFGTLDIRLRRSIQRAHSALHDAADAVELLHKQRRPSRNALKKQHEDTSTGAANARREAETRAREEEKRAREEAETRAREEAETRAHEEAQQRAAEELQRVLDQLPQPQVMIQMEIDDRGYESAGESFDE